jgi:hypothetical protein
LFWILENIGFWFELELELFCKSFQRKKFENRKGKRLEQKRVESPRASLPAQPQKRPTVQLLPLPNGYTAHLLSLTDEWIPLIRSSFLL